MLKVDKGLFEDDKDNDNYSNGYDNNFSALVKHQDGAKQCQCVFVMFKT